jgi:hypothetical protein
MNDEQNLFMITNLVDFKACNRAMDLGEKVWKGALAWDYFTIDTID